MKRINSRLGVLFLFFVLLFTVALARAAWLQGVEGGSLSATAQAQQSEQVVVPGTRGRVLDRTGKVLAVSEDAATVIATPYQVPNPDQAATELSSLVGVPASDLAKKLSDRASGFAYLAHKVDLHSADEIRRLNIPGISMVPDSRRVYPQGDLASQLIGAVGLENQGLTGLEQGEQSTLGGQDGSQQIVRDATGKPIRFEQTKQATTGQDVKLTIDAAIQDHTEQALSEIGTKFSPKGATAIVMDPRRPPTCWRWPTGRRSTPTNLGNATDAELENRATNYTYEPGSTFKAFTVAAGLEDHTVTPSTSFYLPPTIRLYDRVIGEAEARARST